MKALVYYADGVSGKAVTERLAERGEEVVPVDRTLGNEDDLVAARRRRRGREDARACRRAMPLLRRGARARRCRCGRRSSSAFGCCPGSRFVGVTGTNGKTTTTALLGAIFRAAGRDVTVAGNIGMPLTSVREADWVVCELSSFQLEDVHLFACAVAVLLNLEPDHLDRYDSFEAYRDAKLRIFERARAKVVPRGLGSRRDRVRGRRPAAGRAADPRRAQPRERCRRNRRGARGRDRRRRDRRGAAHVPGRAAPARGRRRGGGVRFVNDSKATNVAAARRALAAYEDEPVHLILGGSLKGESFAPLAGAIGANVRSIHLVGEAATELAEAIPARARRRDARARGRARGRRGEPGRRRPAQPGVRELRPVRELRGARRRLSAGLVGAAHDANARPVGEMRERMLRGELYLADDPELEAAMARAQALVERYNATPHAEPELRDRLLRELLGEVGERVVVRSPFHCDYGSHISIGAGTFVNYDCVFLDVVPIRIGAACQIAPTGAAADAPTIRSTREPRRDGWESGKPIVLERQRLARRRRDRLPGRDDRRRHGRRRRRGRHTRPARRASSRPAFRRACCARSASATRVEVPEACR